MGADRMRAAALIIAREAQKLASAWSVQVPPSMKVKAGATSAEISSAVGPSYPNEVPRVRHPVFGHRDRWVDNAYRPFLAPAATAKADAAAAEVAKAVDDICHGLGYAGSG